MKKKSTHPPWAIEHRKPGTELKRIGGKYYLYEVKSIYDKKTKKSNKISLGIIGRITEEDGLIPSDKRALKEKAKMSINATELFSYEYGYAKWLMQTIESENLITDLKYHFPSLWKHIVLMVYCRTAHKSPLKNIPFHQSQSYISELLELKEKMTDKKVCDALFELGRMKKSIHDFMQPKGNEKRTVLIDATDISLNSKGIYLSKEGYNSKMDFEPQFVLLYLYDASSLRPLYYRLLPGNIREISALKNVVNLCGLENCVYIADKGFYSEKNILELESLSIEYIIPLKRDNKLIPYEVLDKIELSNNYFEFDGHFIFYTNTKKEDNRSIELFLDGRLKELEKTDYLKRIKTVPESFSKDVFNEKISSMGTLAIVHNTSQDAKDVYYEYKNRGEIEQFFDHLKNTIDASSSNMQREESLNGWMFINHLSMILIYRLFEILKTTPLNKKQMLNHKYSINDAIMHLQSIKKIKYNTNKELITEPNKLTKNLLEKMKISIT